MFPFAEAAIVVKSKDNLSPLETEFNPSCQRQFSPELGQLLSPPRTPSVSSVTHDFLLSPVDSFALNAYPLQPLLNGATRILEVVYVKDPGDFYCQLADDFDALSEMMSKISKSYKSTVYFLVWLVFNLLMRIIFLNHRWDDADFGIPQGWSTMHGSVFGRRTMVQRQSN